MGQPRAHVLGAELGDDLGARGGDIAQHRPATPVRAPGTRR